MSTVDFSDGAGVVGELSVDDENNLSEIHTQVIAIYDCNADAKDELSFTKGDLLNLVRPSSPHAFHRTPRALFPVQPVRLPLPVSLRPPSC